MIVNEETPSGTPVILTDDWGDKHITKTRSKPWRLPGLGRKKGALIVLVEGRSGGYLCERLEIQKED